MIYQAIFAGLTNSINLRSKRRLNRRLSNRPLKGQFMINLSLLFFNLYFRT